MNNYDSIFRKFLWRSLPAALLIIWGWVQIKTAFGLISQVLVGICSCFLGILIIAPLFIELISEIFSNSPTISERILLIGKDAKEYYEKRFAELKHILVAEPQRVDVYIEMIHIAFKEFKDEHQALKILYNGLNTLKDKSDRELLSEAFNIAKTGKLAVKAYKSGGING
ncbi:MAG: hypothetical protein HQL10_10990 [Nitrospirae bacterium]|nr:hypothetical protein [Nitrospirota bacterium]